MTAVAAVQAATADRGNDTTAWRMFGKAVEHNLSLICRYLWSGQQHNCRVLTLEEVAEEGRVMQYTLITAACTELQAWAVRAGLDLEEAESWELEELSS